MSPENVTPINDRARLWADPESVFVCPINDAPPPRTQKPRRRRTQTPPQVQTTAVSPEQVVARAYALPQCMVCSRPLSEGNRTGYCRDHPASEYRFIECAEPGCSTVKRRTIRGENRYVCPRHHQESTQ